MLSFCMALIKILFYNISKSLRFTKHRIALVVYEVVFIVKVIPTMFTINFTEKYSSTIDVVVRSYII